MYCTDRKINYIVWNDQMFNFPQKPWCGAKKSIKPQEDFLVEGQPPAYQKMYGRGTTGILIW